MEDARAPRGEYGKKSESNNKQFDIFDLYKECWKQHKSESIINQSICGCVIVWH